MTTCVKMERELFGAIIKQNNQNCFFSATDLIKGGNGWRIANGMDIVKFEDWKNRQSTKEFIKELEEQEKTRVIISGRGRGHDTWVHPFIFIDLALWINPKLKVEVYKWLYDSLIQYRNQSGDSYKKMCGALYLTETNKSNFKENMCNLAHRIKIECEVTDWQKATEKQLKLRDKIHENIALLSDVIRDRETLYTVAIKKAKEN